MSALRGTRPTAAVAAVDPARIRRVGLLSVHTSPLDQPGTGDGGGLNVYVREIAGRLAARGVHVDVYTRAADPSLPPTIALEDGVDVHHVVAGPRRAVDKGEVANHLCGFVLALQRHPTAGSHDVLHAHYWLSGWVGRRLASRWHTPLVQTFHTLGVLKNATLAPGDVPEPPLRLVAEERVARDADRIVVLTAGEAALLRRTHGLPDTRLDVVPAGVDLDRFSPVGRTSADPSTPQLLFVGRLQPLKGPDVAVRTLAEVRRAIPGARLRIIGGASGNGQGSTGPEQLRTLAAGLGVADAVEIEPALDQARLALRYREADLLLAPSRSETFGLVALEAQASGTPVVAADVPGLGSVVRGGGVLVPGHDPQDHAAAVVSLLTDRRRLEAARAAGLATASGASWERTVDGLLGVYGEVVAATDRAGGTDGPLAAEDALAG